MPVAAVRGRPSAMPVAADRRSPSRALPAVVAVVAVLAVGSSLLALRARRYHLRRRGRAGPRRASAAPSGAWSGLLRHEPGILRG
jgi:hypothetical protein